MVENRRIEEDEIDLRELFKTLLKNKKFIIVFTAIVTLFAVIYAYMKTPIYEAKALIEIGTYKEGNKTILLDNSPQLVKKMSVLFIDMRKNIKNKKAVINSISVVKKVNTFIEIKASGLSNELIEKQIIEVENYIKNKHLNILMDIKQRRELKIKNIDTKINNIKNKEVKLYEDKISLLKIREKNSKDELLELTKTIEKLKNTNSSLAAIMFLQKRDLISRLSSLDFQLLDLKNKKENLTATGISKLIEQKRSLESMLLPYNYKNSEIVGKIMTNDFPSKPKKKLIVVVAFVTGFILSIFLVFLLEFIRNFKEEENMKND